MNVKELMATLEITPIDQPIMLEAIHGVGKSEIFRDFFVAKGYRMITLFLGQMSDAGDVLGLPDRITIKDEDGNECKLTDFDPPRWWPRKSTDKVCIFLDELNRAKPEILQVIMDMVLNRKLYGKDLPAQTRIVAAINPNEDGLYQVEDLDPALQSRFNKYEFRPTVDEWMDWALKSKVNKYIIGFISKHNNLLDPPDAKEYRIGRVYPNRRSWKRVSDILNLHPELIQNIELLQTIMLGIVGEIAVSAFGKYLRELNTGINVGRILTDFNADLQNQIMMIPVQDILHLNKQMGQWFESNKDYMTNPDNKTNAQKVADNLHKYLNTIPAEAMAEFFNIMSIENNAKKYWPKRLMSLNRNLANKFIDILRGKDDKEDKKLKDNLSE